MTRFLFIIVLTYLTSHLSLDTCVPAEVRYTCVSYSPLSTPCPN